MSEPGSNEPTQPPTTSTARIDQVCDEFEKACRAGRPPLIEDVLMRATMPERDRLLRELLEIEIDCRQRSGTFLQVEEYRQRFPDSPEMVDSVFHRVVKIRRLADYELLEELGHGGMGVVYKARQVFLNQIAAVKILPHRYLEDAQSVSRFRREMQSIGALNHPNIVRAFNAGEAGGVHYLAMEYVDGINLQRFVSIGPPQGGPVGVGAACEILRQAALGLQHAHEHQLVHRDVKPANLMLSRNGEVKILDMGLAKLRADALGNAPERESLTQPGMTMGTIDYMAPEQWENSATADIRADIYSLGCTLYFLLTAKPPYGEPEFESGRKKLMAHAVAPIPSLVDNCADAPQELDDIYKIMLAKNANDRYATPAEVADALAEFADPEELAEVIAALPAQDVCLATDNTGVMGRDADTRRHEAGSAGSTPHRRTQNRWMKRQKFRRNITIGVAAGVTAALCVLFAWIGMRRHADKHAANIEPNTPVVDAPQHTNESSNSPAVRATLASEVALLPGLNGRWWFDEMPWFTPFVRQAIADKVLTAHDVASVLGENPRGYLNPNTNDAAKRLWEIVERCRGDLSPCQQKLIDELRGGQSLEDALQQFVAGHNGRTWSAADLHSRALLQHTIAKRAAGDAASKSAMAAEAAESYKTALDAYAEEHRPTSPQALCLVDFAVFNEQVTGDLKAAKQSMDETLAEGNLPPVFLIAALVERGRIATLAATNRGEYEDHGFVSAKRVLDANDAIKPNHPLAAYIAENHAASLLDQWKVEDASKQFQAAYHVRLINKEEKDPLAALYVFQDRQDSALCSRYRGNIDSARRSFKSLVDEIQAAIDEAPRRRSAFPQALGVDVLQRQLASAREAWADCELYGGAASDGKVNLSQAAENYEKAAALADPSDALAVQYKLAIVNALRGKQKTAEEIVGRLPAKEAASENIERNSLARQLALAVLATKGSAPADGRKMLRAFLDQFKLNTFPRDSHRRDILEMQLFAAELLLTVDFDGETKTTHRDLKYLDALLGVFHGRPDLRPYLRRYYELAVRACGKTDLVQIAQYLLDSRMVERQAGPASRSTLVLFSFTNKENFAIFLPQDGRPGKRFDLDLTRDQIKSARGKPLHLNDELMKLITAEMETKRPIEVLWSDAASRPSEDADAITDGDWPFDSQVELAKIRGK